MKRNKIKNILGWLPASLLLLLAAACSENVLDMASVEEQKTSEVTFTINMESSTVSTRAGEGEEKIKISKGQLADVLVYAFYEVLKDENGEDSLALDKGFGREKTIGKVTAGEGQRLLAVKHENFPVKISLSFDARKKYKMAFWLQNSEIDAYDATNLQAVKVKYKDADDKNFDNNDERRDAFCALSDVLDPLSLNNTVTLRRPLAQVNVGTTGWDYEGAAILKPSSVSYTKSMITLKGVAQYYDVVNGKALSADDLTERNISGDATTDVTFNYARIPAFINVSDEDFHDNLTYSPFSNEEFLKVELDGEEGISPYISWNDYYYTHERKKTIKDTETFKYLSMSYVLVPEAESLKNDDGTLKYPNATNGAVLHNVEFSTQGIDENSSAETAGVGQVFSIPNVPVQKNWRTNILGTNFFFLDQPLMLTVVTDYNGDYNYTGEKKEDEQEEEEVYTDGEIWFGSYDCVSDNQEAKEQKGFFKYLKHNYTDYPVNGPSWHKHDPEGIYVGKYNGKDVGKVLKMQGRTGIAFTVNEPSTLTIVQAISRPSKSPAIADAVLMFYKQKYEEELVDSTGITVLKASDELKKINDAEFKGEAQTTEFTSTLLNPNKPNANYSATIYSSAETIYGRSMNNNTDTNQDVIIHTIYIEEPGTYIIRNGGQQFDAHNTESGLAYIKVRKGGNRLDIDWDWWQKNEYPDDKKSEDETGSSDPADD